jgi:hypothetical protein
MRGPRHRGGVSVKHVRSSYFLALVAVLVVGACSSSPKGNEVFVTVNADSPAAGLPAATDWCAKYGKLPRHSSSTKNDSGYIQNYDCVARS